MTFQSDLIVTMLRGCILKFAKYVCVDYRQALKRTDGWIVESASFSLTTFMQILALCKYSSTKAGTGEGSFQPFNSLIGPEGNN
jgi:hypothetical protein